MSETTYIGVRLHPEDVVRVEEVQRQIRTLTGDGSISSAVRYIIRNLPLRLYPIEQVNESESTT